MKIPVSDIRAEGVLKAPLRRWHGICLHCTGVIRIPGHRIPAYPDHDRFYMNDVDFLHRKIKFWRRGCGYHIGIGNMVMDKRIEVSERWINQLDGAHCRGLNSDYIGVCCWGDFTRVHLSMLQESLLVKTLVELMFHIPTVSMLKLQPHNWFSVKACPGTVFPFNRILIEVNNRLIKRRRDAQL